jgi:hypothetical protein
MKEVFQDEGKSAKTTQREEFQRMFRPLWVTRNLVESRRGPNIVPDGDTADLVKRAFELFSTGLHSQAEVLRIITSHALQTPLGATLEQH